MNDVATALSPLVSADNYLEKNDLKKYSLLRLVKKAAGIHKDWSLETEVSDDLRLKYKNNPPGQGYLIPPVAIGLRAVATDNTGASLIGSSTNEEAFNFAPEPKSEVLKLGGKLITGLKNNFEILGTDTPFEAYFVAQRSSIPNGNKEVRKIKMKPHKLGVLCTLTLEMLEQAPLEAERYLVTMLQRALARKIDQTVFMGAGVDEPLGLVSHPDVNSITLGLNGGSLSLASILAMERLVCDNNPEADSLAYFVNSEVQHSLKSIEKAPGTGQFLMSDQLLLPLDGVKVLNNRRAIVTNNLPKNLVKGTNNDLSMIVFGDWSQVVVGFWGAVSLDIDPYSKQNFDEGLVTVRLLAMVDVAILNPQLFCVCTDVQTNN